MLVQLLVLLSLGVLCSSAPMRTSPISQQNSQYDLGNIIKEAIEDIKQLEPNEVPPVSPDCCDAKIKQCMQSYLRDFEKVLAKHNIKNTVTRKLKLIKSHVNMPKDSGKNCKVGRVTTIPFWNSLDTYLRLLYGAI